MLRSGYRMRLKPPQVEGDITSPGIELDGSCYFRGEVDMGAGHGQASSGDPGPSTASGRSPSPSPNGEGNPEPGDGGRRWTSSGTPGHQAVVAGPGLQGLPHGPGDGR